MLGELETNPPLNLRYNGNKINPAQRILPQNNAVIPKILLAFLIILYYDYLLSVAFFPIIFLVIGMSIKGDLSTFNLKNLFHFISQGKKTGILTIQQGSIRRTFHFKEGKVIYASSSLEADRLGTQTLRIIPLQREMIELCLSKAQMEGQPLGAYLPEIGLNPQDIGKVVQIQARQIIFKIILASEGSFLFEETPQIYTPQNMVRADMDPVELFNQGESLLTVFRQFEKRIYSPDIIFSRQTSGYDSHAQIQLDRLQWKILSLIDGYRSVRDLQSQMSDLDIMDIYQALNDLLDANLIDYKSKVKEYTA